MSSRSRDYVRRHTLRRNTRSNNTNNNNRSNNNDNHTISLSSIIQNRINNQQRPPFPLDLLSSSSDDDDDIVSVLVEMSNNNNSNEETTIFDTSITIPRPVTKNINTVVFDLHGINPLLPIVLLLLENQYGFNEIVSITHLQPSVKYCSTSCLVVEVLFKSQASIEKAINHQGLTIGNLQILGAPVVNTIHYKDIFKYQENDFDLSLSLIHWPNQYNPNNTKCTVYTIFNLPMTNDVASTIHNIKDSIIYMENWLKLKKNGHPPSFTSNDSNNNNNNGFYGPVSTIPSDDSPFIGVFPVQYPGTHIKKNAYFVVVHGHMMNYSVFQNSTPTSSDNRSPSNHSSSSNRSSSNRSSSNRSSISSSNNAQHDDGHHHNRYHGKNSARLICFNNGNFFYDRITFDRTFCFHCKEPDCHFTEDCPLDDVIDNFRSLCVHQLSN